MENSISREKESFNARRAQVSTCKHDPRYLISFKREDVKKQPHQPKLKVRERQHGAVTFIFQTAWSRTAKTIYICIFTTELIYIFCST